MILARLQRPHGCIMSGCKLCIPTCYLTFNIAINMVRRAYEPIPPEYTCIFQSNPKLGILEAKIN